MKEYIVVSIETEQSNFDLLSATLLDLGADSFFEDQQQLSAYFEDKIYSESKLKEVLENFNTQFKLTYTIDKLENKNWNEEWERNFVPVEVEDSCIVRASFHELTKNYTYDIIINPKMSFGTGHHETTHMMLEHILAMDLNGKNVMDAGAGTGILSILAAKKQAKAVVAFDIEDWAYHNAIENAKLNHCEQIHVLQGNIENLKLPFQEYDVILANINKNVLLEEISVYYKFLKTGGILLLSGFFENDIADIETKAKELNYLLEQINVKNNWASLRYKKA